MKKLLIFIPLLLGTCITASAETIYTQSADERADILYKATHESTVSVMSDRAERAAAERILLIRSDTDIEDCGAQYDICDKYGIHALVYATAGDADAAYEYYIENDYPVCRNMMLTISEDTPSRTYFPYLSWGVRYIGADLFMDGLQSEYATIGSMPPVTVAVLDSGIDYNHPRLANRVDEGRGYDYVNNKKSPMDDNHHGTHVAGIIADNTLENVTLIPIKVSNSKGGIEPNDLVSGMEKALELDVDIINMSLSADHELSSSETANIKNLFASLFDEAEYRGITICVSAGNCTNNSINANYVFPAFFESTISVANCRADGTISNTSNYGSVIDIAAPGTNIYSTYPVSMGSYRSLSGTSMATPFVTAAAALLKTTDPFITPDEIDSTLKSHIQPFSESYSKRYGKGILYIGDIYEYTDIPIYDAITACDHSGADITLTIDNSKKILRNGGCLVLKGSVLGSMTQLWVENIPASPEAEVTVTFKGYGTNDRFGAIDAYLWKSLSDQKPLAKAYAVK